jgi:hypothetical protein
VISYLCSAHPSRYANLPLPEGIMGRGISMLVILVVLTAVSVSSQQSGPAQRPVESHVVPLKKFSKLAMDKRYETVSGDPAKAGAPFVIRIHAEAGYIIMPHTHPTPLPALQH